jgi:hypothetical protein
MPETVAADREITCGDAVREAMAAGARAETGAVAAAGAGHAAGKN